MGTERTGLSPNANCEASELNTYDRINLSVLAKFSITIHIIRDTVPPEVQSDQNDHMVLPLSSIDHQHRRLHLLGENRYPVSQVISGGEDRG